MNAIGARKAAVLLAGMHPRDRRWMLARLAPAWRVALKPLIAEAGKLGAVDFALARGAVAFDRAVTTDVETPAPEVLLAGLSGLSPAWAARILAACAPDHLGLYAAHCDAVRAEATRQEFARLPATLPPKLAKALAQAVCARAAGRPMASGAE